MTKPEEKKSIVLPILQEERDGSSLSEVTPKPDNQSQDTFTAQLDALIKQLDQNLEYPYVFDIYLAFVDKGKYENPPQNYTDAMGQAGFRKASPYLAVTKERLYSLVPQLARSNDQVWVTVSVYTRPQGFDRFDPFAIANTKKQLEGTLV